PPLEAMACGCPVVMFDNSSLPEVAGEAAHMVRDGDAPAMTAAVSQLLTGAPEPEARRREGIRWAGTFSWRATAERTLAVYRSLA
ncbi:MAG TPA: glycosyltransferase, partial [Candidatus Sulfotelmatobacter sp.]|nr:glycosyltransferase [Candidatus Sulfotelmatobacter sp.]